MGAPAPDGDDEPFGPQGFDGLADGAAGDAVLLHELAFRRQGITGPVLTRLMARRRMAASWACSGSGSRWST